MDEVVFIPIPLEDFKALVAEIVQEALAELRDKDDTPAPDDDYITISDVCRLLKRSRPTIHQWKKKGILPFYRLGGNVYFKRHEVLEAPKRAQLKLTK